MSKIEIRKIGITKVHADAIVNAANEHLAPGGGVCGAIFEEAGYNQLNAACMKVGGCATGSAAITPGFALPSKYIIHAVGPVYSGGGRGEAKKLYSCYKASMELAKENNCHSIAFPLISSGIFGYPKKEAWEVAISAVSDFQKENSNYELDVIFCALSDEIISLGTNVLKGHVGQISGSNQDTDFTFFWQLGKPNEELSNWYNAKFIVEGITYNCVEQYMMAKKALLFKDFENYILIMNQPDPEKCKELGKLVRNFDGKLWDSCKYQIVYNANFAKFSQNELLKEKLLLTGESILAEASPYDAVWGIKMTADDPDAKTPANWKGQNLLGNILMQVRNVLKTAN